MERQFTSGSRQAPDPFDKFLEEHNFYRKYTARDASCLFRVISEQMYDTQLHHMSIRKKCVRYMRRHSDYFQPLIARDLEEYLHDLANPKTYGTLIELQAVGFMYERNVLLFEPFNTGSYYVNNPFFTGTFRIFYTAKQHFDSVFSSDYIKDVAVCQSICYEILYKDVFKLPDVKYAVEQMLHATSLEETNDTRTDYNAEGYCTRMQLADGRIFDFDLPQNTNCILENYKYCHFHYNDFLNDWSQGLRIYNNGLVPADYYSSDVDLEKASDLNGAAVESVLPHKHLSCVRQLLREGITPFPYKVAKALDPNMYRNIEFDAWNEMRKENLQYWYNGDTNFKSERSHKKRLHKIFQVGAKCHVKLRKFGNDLYTCHIQEIALDKGYCLVFIEQLGEKHLVPYDSLKPLPQDQFQPWSLPYHLQRQMQKCSALRLTRHYNYRVKLNGQLSSAHRYHGTAGPYMPHIKDCADQSSDREMIVEHGKHHNSCYYKLKQYTHLENFRTNMLEYCTMPLTVDHTARKLSEKSGQHEDNIASNALDNSPGAATCTPVTTRNDPAKTNDAETGVVEHVAAATAMENYEMVNHGAIDMTRNAYVPELHCFYPFNAYPGAPEEYYSYVFDGMLQPPPAALAPTAAVNGGPLYYMCNPNFCSYPPAPNGIYMPPPPPAALAAPPAVIPALSTPDPSGAYCTSACFNGNGMVMTPTRAATYNSLPMGVNNSNGSNFSTPNRYRTPAGNASTDSSAGSSGHDRVNFDAKKSIKMNGGDLPNDVATLRYFYNLGLEYHHIKSKQSAQVSSKDDSNGKLSLSSEKHKTQSHEHSTEDEQSTVDANNNTMTNFNTQQHSNGQLQNGKANSTQSLNSAQNQSQGGHSSNGPQQQQQHQQQQQQQQQQQKTSQQTNHHSMRRNGTRYYNGNNNNNNNKDRQTYQRNGSRNGMTTSSNRYQKDYNGKNCKQTNPNDGACNYDTRGGGGGGGGGSGGGQMNHHMSNSTHINQLGGGGGMSTSVNEHHQINHTNMMGNYDCGLAPPNANAAPLQSINYGGAANPMLPYRPCDYGTDNGHTANGGIPPAGGMFIPMPLAPTAPYGLYATAPPGTPAPSGPPALGMFPAMGNVYPPYPCPIIPQVPAPPGNLINTSAPPPPPLGTLGIPAHANTNGFYMAPPTTVAGTDVGSEHGSDVMHGTCMTSYATPPFSYPPPNSGGVMSNEQQPTPMQASTNAANHATKPSNLKGPPSLAQVQAGGGLQGHWCAPLNTPQNVQTPLLINRTDASPKTGATSSTMNTPTSVVVSANSSNNAK